MTTKKKKNGDELVKQALEEEHRIRKAFKDKDWAEIKSSDSWVIFKVMSEFVEGFEKLAKIGPCVTIFGSARVKAGHPYYKTAEEIAFQLVQHGYGVVTGGGPGTRTLTIGLYSFNKAVDIQNWQQGATSAWFIAALIGLAGWGYLRLIRLMSSRR